MEQILGYRKNAYIGTFTEATYPHDVIRQMLQYGTSLQEDLSKNDYPLSIPVDTGFNMNYAIVNATNKEDQIEILDKYLSKFMYKPALSLNLTKEIIGDDNWVGYVPSEHHQGVEGLIPFVPPKDFENEMPMPEKMPSVISMSKTKIFEKIIASIKKGIPVPFCYLNHCMSIDGLKINHLGEIEEVYYANSGFGWGNNQDFKWGNGFEMHRGFIFLIMD